MIAPLHNDENEIACPLCSGRDLALHARAHDIEYVTSDRSYRFWRCLDCDVLFIDPMLHDQLRSIYPENYYSFVASKPSLPQRIKMRLDRAAFRKILAEIPGSKLSVLDVGGGTGWLLDLIKEADPRVEKTMVIDIDPAGEQIALKAGHDYFLGRVEDYVGGERSFDLILMLNLVEHVADPCAVLSKAKDLLKPGGRLLIKTPNFDALDARLFRNHSWAGFHTPRHFVIFNKPSFEKLAARAGLEVERANYTQGAPFWSISVLDLLKRLSLVTITKERAAIYHPLVPFLQMAFGAFDFTRRPFAKLSQMEFVLRKASD